MQLDIKEVVYSFFMYFDDEGRAWILTIVCKEKKIIKKIKNIWYFNKI